MIILGTGIMAYILNRLYPGSTMIDHGQGGNKVKLPPLFHIHHNPDVERIIKKCNIEYSLKTIKVGYSRESNLINPENITDKERKFYAHKTYKIGGSNRVLNGDKKSYKAIILKDDLVCDGNWINAEIVTLKDKKIGYITRWDGKYIECDRGAMISTLPLDITFELLDVHVQLQSFPVNKFWYKMDSLTQRYYNQYDFDFIYEVSPEIRYNRYIKVDDIWYGEVTTIGEMPDYDFCKTNAQITDNIGIESIDGISLFGRYARWDNRVLIHNEINRIIKYGF